MLRVHCSTLSGIYLLTLVPGIFRPSEVALTRSLYHATRRRHRDIWLDCGQVRYFTPDALELLLTFDASLPAIGCQLFFCRLRPTARQQLLDAALRGNAPLAYRLLWHTHRPTAAFSQHQLPLN